MTENRSAQPIFYPLDKLWKILIRAFGMLFLLVGLGLFLREINFARQAVSAAGKIVEIRQTENSDGPVYTPVVEFSTPDKQVIHFDGMPTDPPRTVGQAVPVLYRQSNPQEARIDRFVDRWLFPTIFTAVGLLVILFSSRRLSEWLKFKPVDASEIQ